MKRLLFLTTLLFVSLSALTAEEAKRRPDILTLTLAMIAEPGESKQYVFVINGVVAFKTVDRLKGFLKDLPKGSTLTWDPGCCREGGEPLLNSAQEMEDFRKFCESCGIKFTLKPSG